MRKRLFRFALAAGCAVVAPVNTQQAWIGTISDARCGAAHQQAASPAGLTDRQCIFECIKASSKYVLVDASGQVFAITNQDAIGLPFYTGRSVRLTGDLTASAIVVSAIEPVPAHVHIGHVMTTWSDTPEKVGLLRTAISDAAVAAVQARLADQSRDSLADMQLHAEHVLQALEPMLQQNGPASGYGVKKAAAGARQHLTWSVEAEGATANFRMRAAPVSATIDRVLVWIDQAVAVAQQIRSVRGSVEAAAEAAALVSQLTALTGNIRAGLNETQSQMESIMKGEGL